MAVATKTKKSTEKVVEKLPKEIMNHEPVDNTNEVTELKTKISSLEDMVMKLLGKLDESKQEVQNVKSETQKSKESNPTHITDDDYTDMDDIPFKTFIKVMSLTPNVLTLATDGVGRGTLYTFQKFGEIQHIMYEDLHRIIVNNESFARKGKFYIMHPQVRKLHGLNEYYKNILTKEQIQNIMDFAENEMVNLFKTSTQTIKETIVTFLIEKIVNGETLDLNKLAKISDIYGRDIYAMAKETKELINNR